MSHFAGKIRDRNQYCQFWWIFKRLMCTPQKEHFQFLPLHWASWKLFLLQGWLSTPPAALMQQHAQAPNAGEAAAVALGGRGGEDSCPQQGLRCTAFPHCPGRSFYNSQNLILELQVSTTPENFHRITHHRSPGHRSMVVMLNATR